MDSRYDSFCTLLASADPADLPPRRHHQTYAGDSTAGDRIKWELAAAYVGHRMHEHGHTDAVLNVRRVALRVLKRTA
jgi:hypothetical protein